MSDDDHKLTNEERRKRQRELKKKRLGKSRFLATNRMPPEIAQDIEREVMKEEFVKPTPEEILGMRLFQAAQDLDEKRVKELVEEGAPINYADPHSGCTPIFPLSIWERWDSVQYLLDTGECNLLIRNNKGRLLSTRIGEETGNMMWAKKIMAIELEQGRKEGIVPRIRGDEDIEPPIEPT